MPDPNTVAVGAPFNDGTGSNAGHVRVFGWNGSAWVQQCTDMDGEAAGDYFGYILEMPDANTVAVGAVFNNGTGLRAGHARVFDRNGGIWVQRGIDMDGEATYDEAGYAVSMPTDNTVAVGAIFNAGTGSDAGHVRIYEDLFTAVPSALAETPSLSASPNPTAGHVEIALERHHTSALVIARNVVGTEVGRWTCQSCQVLSFDLNQAAGVYFLEVSAEEERGVMKLLKE
jgi:hypothetical protein